MKVCIVGTGYVGLVTGAGLAEMGNHVICVDNNAQKIERLKQGYCPIYEPGLEELMKTNYREGRLVFTTELEQAVEESSVCMIAVGTPQNEDGSANLSSVYDVAKAIGKNLNSYKVIATKSTVPVGTADKVKEIIAQETQQHFAVVSNPEFLKQGNAVDDFLYPDRVVIGADDDLAKDMMRELYAPFLKTGNPVIFISVRSAEMCKYAANAFLATKISFINEMATLAEKVDADIADVRTAIATDKRIGPEFLFPGLGFGGSCFPKDIRALTQTAQLFDFKCELLEQVDGINQRKRQEFIEKIESYFKGQLKGKTFAVWGLAFKPRTDDMREAPSIDIINWLLKQGASVKAFDPKAMDTARKVFGEQSGLAYTTGAYEALDGADALLLLTEWNEFRRPDFDKLKVLLKQPVIFDGRNQYDPERLEKRGFDYLSVGRKAVYAYSQQPLSV